MNYKFGEFVVKNKKLIIIISLLLLIPSIFGMMATRVNYDILSFGKNHIVCLNYKIALKIFEFF